MIATDYPLISVIVPVRNEGKYIASTLSSLISQDYPCNRFEILVVDGMSTDDTVKIAASFSEKDPRVRIILNPARLSSAGRNLGVIKSIGDIILFIDGHIYIDNNQLLANTYLFMHNNNVSVLSRPQFLNTPTNNLFQKAVSFARKSAIGHATDSTIYLNEDKYVSPLSSGAAYKREVFETVGHFDESFDACEDVEFNYRVAQCGYTSFTSMKVAVYYYPRNSFTALFAQMLRYGAGRFRLAKKHPRSLTVTSLIPALFVGGTILCSILSLFIHILLYVICAILLLYALLVLGWSIRAIITYNINMLFIMPGIYIAIHVGIGWGFISELLRYILNMCRDTRIF